MLIKSPPTGFGIVRTIRHHHIRPLGIVNIFFENNVLIKV
jgi:hypothetical protein